MVVRAPHGRAYLWVILADAPDGGQGFSVAILDSGYFLFGYRYFEQCFEDGKLKDVYVGKFVIKEA